VVEHGLFIDMAHVVIIGRGEDAEVLAAGPRTTRRH